MAAAKLAEAASEFVAEDGDEAAMLVQAANEAERELVVANVSAAPAERVMSDEERFEAEALAFNEVGSVEHHRQQEAELRKKMAEEAAEAAAKAAAAESGGGCQGRGRGSHGTRRRSGSQR